MDFIPGMFFFQECQMSFVCDCLGLEFYVLCLLLMTASGTS